MKAMRGDLQIGDPDVRELLVGTCFTIGEVADALAGSGSGEPDRGQLFTRLGAAEAKAQTSGREFARGASPKDAGSQAPIFHLDIRGWS